MKKTFTPLMIFGLIWLTIALLSWFLFPSWSQIPGGFLTLAGLTAIGVIAFLKDGYSFIKDFIDARHLIDADSQQIENHDLFSEDDSQITNIRWNDRDPKLIAKYMDLCSEIDPKFAENKTEAKFLRYCISMGLARNVSGNTFLTQTGVILFCRKESFPHTKYHIDITFKDNDHDLSKEFSAPILESYFSILELLTPLTVEWRDPSKRESTGQESIFFFYPQTAIVEALVNFFIHRDYKKDDIGYITIYPDRIEFENPGQSLYPIDELNNATQPLKPQYKRNPRLVQAFRKTGLNQREGRGILRIKHELGKNGSVDTDGNLGLRIENEISNDRFRLIIYKKISPVVEDNTVNYYTGEVLSSKPATPPRPLHYFIGREKILSQIKSILLHDTQPNVIAITGMGGVGKTSLALQITNDAKDKFADNIFWGDLNEFDGDAIRILRLWAEYCGQKLPVRAKAEELANQVRGLLTERQKIKGSILVVIDDLRENWLEAGEILRNAIPANVPIIITTREIGVAQSLKAKMIFNLDENSLSDSEASRMLIIRSDNKLDSAQSKIVADLCEKMPLALELAAQVAKAEGAKYLLDKLSDATKRLDVLMVGSRERKDLSVKATFEISYDSLPANATLVFRYLGAFASNAITAQHLSDVFSYSKKDIDVDDELRFLRRYSFLQNNVTSNERVTYSMHTLLHDYSNSLLKGKEMTEARQGHFACFQNFAQSYADLDLTNRNNNKVQEFEIFYPQMMQALINFELVYKLAGSKINGKQLQSSIALIDILDKYWTLHDNFENQGKWLEFAYDISTKIKLRLKQADFARRVGRLMGRQGKLAEGIKWMKRCETILADNTSKESHAILALMHIHRASLKYQKGSLETAEKDCMAGLKMVTAKTQPRIYAEGYNLLGVIKIRTNKLPQAMDALEKSLLAWKQVGDQYQIQRTEENYRSALYYIGDIAQLRDAEEKSLQYWQQFPYHIQYAAALTNRGLLHYIDEEYETAIELHQHAMELSDSLGSPRLRALTKLNLAWPFISLEKYDLAENLLNESLNIQEEYDIREFWIDANRCLAEVEIGRKNYTRAIELAEIAVGLAQEDDDPLEEGAALRVSGQAHHLNGDWKKSLVELKKSFALLRDNGYKHESYLSLLALSKLYRDMGNTPKTEATFSQAQTLAKEMGIASKGSRAVNI